MKMKKNQTYICIVRYIENSGRAKKMNVNDGETDDKSGKGSAPTNERKLMYVNRIGTITFAATKQLTR